MSAHRRLFQILSVVVIASMLSSGAALPSAAAQGTDGIERQVNAQTGKVSFIGPETGQVLPASDAPGKSTRPQDPAMALAKRFGPEFGLQDPGRELTVMKSSRAENGRISARYQQNYQGIPVIGGELIVNTNQNGDLYSMSGEVSVELSLSIQPAIESEQARQTALQAVASLYQKALADFTASEPALWIYDERLLRPSTRPAELVWRMEVTPKDKSMPVRELVLVNAQRGNISLHFNQIDTAWKDLLSSHSSAPAAPLLSPNGLVTSATIKTPYWDMVIDTTRNLIYATGSKDEYNTPKFSRVDVIDLNTLALLRSVNLGANVNTRYADLSPDKNLLAVTDFESDKVYFIDLRSIKNLSSPPAISSETLTPCEIGASIEAFDVVFLNNTTLYATGYDECIYRINLNTHSTNAVSSLFLGATRLALSPDRSYLYASSFGSYQKRTAKFAVQADGSLVVQKETSFGTVDFTISSDGKAFVDSFGSVYSTDDFSLVGIFARPNVLWRAIYIPGHHVIAALYGDQVSPFMDFVNATTLFATSVFTFPSTLLGNGDNALAVSPTGDILLIANTNGLIRMDLSSPLPGSPVPLPGNTAYAKLLFDQNRDVFYGVDPTGHKIDVISNDTYQVIGQHRFINGARPASIAISPDGAEIAVSLRGLQQIHFIDPDTWELIARLQLTNVYEGVYNDLVYGRPGRLYTPCSIVNTSTHTEIRKLPVCFENTPYLAITQDTNTLYVNEHFSPQKMYKFNISTDTATLISTTPHTSNYYGYRFIVLPNGTKLYTDGWQIWSADLSTLLGMLEPEDESTTITPTYPVYVPSLDKVAFVIQGNLTKPNDRSRIVFVDAGDNSTDLIFDFPYSGVLGASVASPDGNSLLVSTDHLGLVKIDLVSFPPDPTLYGPPLITYTNQSGGGHYTPIGSSKIQCINRDDDCTFGADSDADDAHKYTHGAIHLYDEVHGRYNVNLLYPEEPIKSVVHYGFSEPNAFWDGWFLVYTDGFPADDVVAHELTHAVTQNESNLFYYYQSGAINESFSDLWGEFYDQTNGLGTDTASVKWLLGENIVEQGAIRSMSNPPAYNDPDRMSSSFYYEGAQDSGGVHINSGVNNKAVFLMVNGGAFNGKTVTALGWEKTAVIYYEVNTNLLTSGADYSDLYYALQKACSSLIGQKGITAGDCLEVKDAVDAVEMNGQPATNFNTDAPLCTTAGAVPNIFFADDLETGISNWTFHTISDPYANYMRWQWDSPYGPYAQSGLHALYADDYPARFSDATARLKSIPIPNNAYLHFAQAYDFETGYYIGDPTLYNFDGGVLEYSTNNGSTWLDAGPLMDFNGYKGRIRNGYRQDGWYENPLKGRSAFVGSSHGYISTRLNLASLAGKNVTFRWRMGLDEEGLAWGWWVDNIRLYTCGIPQPGGFNKTEPANAATNQPTGTTLRWGASSAATSYQYCYDTVNDSACSNWISTGTSTSKALSGLSTGTTYYWHVRAINSAGTTYSNGSPTGFWSFRTRNLPGVFSKTSPANGNTGVSLNTTLSWSSSPDADSYQYCYDIINDSQCNRTWNPVPTTSVGVSNLGTSTTYYWQVRAVNTVGTTDADSQSWGSFTTTSTLPAGLTGIEAFVGAIKQGKYSLGDGQSLRESYTGVNNGPVKLASTTSTPLIGAERLIYKVSGVNTSFTEMMGLPDGQLDTTYWLPWYNNVDLDTQLRIGNVSGVTATVHIFIGPSEVTPVEGITLPAGGSTRVSYTGVNNGPVKIVSDQNIVAAERLIYKVAGKNTSFSEMMALPNNQLDTMYWLPWYNNVDLDTQLRFANVSGSSAQVHVYIGGVEMPNSPFTLLPGESTRQSFTGVNNGPVQIVSNVNIVAAERLIYKVGGKNTSFTEMMALPNTKLDTTYWLPWYNNVDLDTQLRFANVHDTQTATVHVYIGGVEMPNSPFTLLPGESTRQSFMGVNNGPVQVVSNVNIVAAERLIYKVAGVNTSFSEMMALPNTQLDTTYWLPWYNNVDLDTQLRFGAP